MELRHLRYFVAAAQTENVSKAALKLHVSQPALSRQIHDLEDELGFSLFERDAKSVHLTEAGKVFLTEAQAVLQRAAEAISAARAVATGRRGELHVGYAPSPTARILPATLRAFQTDFPAVRVKLHDLATGELLEGVREGTLQLALLVRPHPALLRGLHFEELARDEMRLALPPNHPLARLRSVPLPEGLREPLVIFSRKEYPEYYEYLERLYAPMKTPPRVAEEHDSAASLIAAIESGAGLAVVPESFSCFAGTRLKLMPLSPLPERIVIGVVWLEAGLTEAGKGFWNAAKRVASTTTGPTGDRQVPSRGR